MPIRKMTQQSRHTSQTSRDKLVKPTVTSETHTDKLKSSSVLVHLKFCQNIAVESSETFCNRFMEAWLKSFDEAIDNARSNQLFVELLAVQKEVRNQALEIKTFFCRNVSQGFVKFQRGELDTIINLGEQASSVELGLVDDQALEESIAINSVCHRMESDFSESIWASNQRLAVLNCGDHVSDESNPFAPVQFCNSLMQTLDHINLDIKYKITAYRVFGEHLAGLQKTVLDQCNHYLKKNGILPTLKYQSQTVGRGVTRQYKAITADSIEGEVLRENITSNNTHELELMQTIQGLLSSGNANRTLDLVSHNVRAGKEKIDYASSAGFVGALQAIQKVEIHIQLGTNAEDFSKPLNIEGASHKILDQILDQDAGNAIAKDDRHIIDLVGMLFEYMLNDENLPDNVKTLLSHLHTPFLKIAFLDPGFFELSEHPVRLLLNALTEAGSRWLDKDGKPSLDLLNKLKDVVRSVLEANENEVKTVVALLLKFRADTKKIVRKQDLLEKSAREKAEGESRLRTAKLRVRNEIKTLISNKKLPSPVLLFLLKAWTDYMCIILLRQGDESDTWKKALKLVQDMIWVIGTKTTEEDRKLQKELTKPIIIEAQKGLESISFAQDTSERLITALASTLSEISKKQEISIASTKEREEFEAQADKKAGVKKSLHAKPTATELDMMEKLKLMEFGSWVEFLDGRRSKISWYDYQNNEYLLVNPMGQKDRMLNALEFARSMISQEVKIIAGSAKPFFERALEHIVNRLNEKQKDNNLNQDGMNAF